MDDTIHIQSPSASIKTSLLAGDLDQLIDAIAADRPKVAPRGMTVCYADRGVDRAKARALRLAISRQERKDRMVAVR